MDCLQTILNRCRTKENPMNEDILVEVMCTYCRKYFKHVNDTNKCVECDKQFKSVVNAITKRYGGVLKRLAER